MMTTKGPSALIRICVGLCSRSAAESWRVSSLSARELYGARESFSLTVSLLFEDHDFDPNATQVVAGVVVPNAEVHVVCVFIDDTGVRARPVPLSMGRPRIVVNLPHKRAGCHPLVGSHAHHPKGLFLSLAASAHLAPFVAIDRATHVGVPIWSHLPTLVYERLNYDHVTSLGTFCESRIAVASVVETVLIGTHFDPLRLYIPRVDLTPSRFI